MSSCQQLSGPHIYQFCSSHSTGYYLSYMYYHSGSSHSTGYYLEPIYQSCAVPLATIWPMCITTRVVAIPPAIIWTLYTNLVVAISPATIWTTNRVLVCGMATTTPAIYHLMGVSPLEAQQHITIIVFTNALCCHDSIEYKVIQHHLVMKTAQAHS